LEKWSNNIEKKTDRVEKRTDQMENKIEDVLKTLLQIQTDYGGFYSGYIVWRIPDISNQLNKAITGGLYSPPFYSSREGYKMCLIAHLNGDGTGKGSHLSVYFAIMRGEYDPLLKWPFMAKVTITLLNQEHSKNNKDRIFILDSNSGCVQMPTTSLINNPAGFARFMPRSFLNSRRASYVKEDVMYIKAVVDTSIK